MAQQVLDIPKVGNVSKVALRPYQIDVHTKLVNAWEAGNKKVVMQLPTGGGKTEVAIAEVERRLAMGQKDILFLVHRDDLVYQTMQRMERYGIKCCAGSGTINNRWKPGKGRPEGVVVMCVQTYVKRLAKDKTAGKGAFKIADEMHWYPDDHSWGNAIRDDHDEALGMSGTVWRMDVLERFDTTWDTLICGPQTDELVELGYLAPSYIKDVSTHVRGEILTRKADMKRNQDGFDHTATWENNASKGTLTIDAVAIWYAEAKEQQTIAFALTVEHAYALEKIFNATASSPGLKEHGFGPEQPVSRVIVGETQPAERRRILQSFANKTTRVLITVDVLREGFDAPEASCLVVLRHTQSVVVWRQMVGRVIRPKQGGKSAIILDIVENHKKLGFPDDKYTWTLKPRIEGEREGKAPVKTCREVGGRPDCSTVNHLPTHNCISCKAPFGRVCPADPDGCGQWRPWKKWSGMFEQYRENACDHCGEKSQELQFHRERAERAKAREEQKKKEEQKYARMIANEQLRRFGYEKCREANACQLHSRDGTFQEMLRNHGKPVPQWPWRLAKTGNGFVISFALCNVWAGSQRDRNGIRHRWNIFQNDETSPEIADRIMAVNKLLDMPASMTSGMQTRFDTVQEAQIGLEALFDQFDPDNKRMLMGDLCEGCKTKWVSPAEDGSQQRCTKCRFQKYVEKKHGTHGLDIAF